LNQRNSLCPHTSAQIRKCEFAVDHANPVPLVLRRRISLRAPITGRRGANTKIGEDKGSVERSRSRVMSSARGGSQQQALDLFAAVSFFLLWLLDETIFSAGAAAAVLTIVEPIWT